MPDYCRVSNHTWNALEVRCGERTSRTDSSTHSLPLFAHQLDLLEGDHLLTSLQSSDWPALFSLHNLSPRTLYQLRVYSLDATSGTRSAPLVFTARTARGVQSGGLQSSNSAGQPQQRFHLTKGESKQQTTLSNVNTSFLPSIRLFGVSSRLALLCLLSACCLLLLTALFVLILVRVRSKRPVKSKQEISNVNCSSGHETQKNKTEKRSNRIHGPLRTQTLGRQKRSNARRSVDAKCNSAQGFCADLHNNSHLLDETTAAFATLQPAMRLGMPKALTYAQSRLTQSNDLFATSSKYFIYGKHKMYT